MSIYSNNDLRVAEREALYLLAEECAEVVQACMKILRHGPESYNPDDDDHINNLTDLRKEIGDVEAAVDIVCKNVNGVSRDAIRAHAIDKLARVGAYLHRAKLP